MKQDNTILQKSDDFAVRIINLYKHLAYEKNEYVLSKQILRSGTSIGANICEAVCGFSKKDFLSKMYIAFKESNETLYWIHLLYRTEYIDKEGYLSIKKDCEDIINMLSSITKTTSNSIKNS